MVLYDNSEHIEHVCRKIRVFGNPICDCPRTNQIPKTDQMPFSDFKTDFEQ